MSSLAHSFLPRDPSGRFIRRANTLPLELPAPPPSPLFDSPSALGTPTRLPPPVWNDSRTPLPAPNFTALDSGAPHSSPDSDSDNPLVPPSRPQATPIRAWVVSNRGPVLSSDSGQHTRLPILLRPPTTMKQNTTRMTTLMPPPAVPRSGIGPVAMPHPRSSHAPIYSGLVNDSIEDFL